MNGLSLERLRAAKVIILPLVFVAVVAIDCGGSGGGSSSSPTSLNTIFGSGVVVEESRPVSGIAGVRLESVAQVHIEQGSTEALTVRAEDNLMPHIITEVVGGILVITTPPGLTIENTRDIEMELTVRTLDRAELTGVGSIVAPGLNTNSLTLTLTGVGDLVFSGLNANRLDATLSGVGGIGASGQVQEQHVTVSGVGDYEASDLRSVEAVVVVSSTGSATVRVSGRLTVTISASGSVFYIGNPTIQQTITGSGQLVQIDG